jgi:hypothetical protein
VYGPGARRVVLKLVSAETVSSERENGKFNLGKAGTENAERGRPLIPPSNS